MAGFPYITRDEAKALGLKRYFTGKPCKYGHISEHRVSGAHCVGCDTLRHRRFRERHPGRNAEYRRRHYKNNREKHKAGVRRWVAENKESYNQTRREWYAKNKERMAERTKEWRDANPPSEKQRRAAVIRAKRWVKENPGRRKKIARNWVRDNPGKANANTVRRRARKLHATPAWVDLGAIRAIYVDAAQVSRETGQAHHVDHIVPLRGEGVCGLHVPWNLRVLPAYENRRKGNRLST